MSESTHWQTHPETGAYVVRCHECGHLTSEPHLDADRRYLCEDCAPTLEDITRGEKGAAE